MTKRLHRIGFSGATGDGTFEELPFPQDGKWAVAAAWFDYDNDGLLDLFVVRYVEWDEAKEIYCGTTEYRPLANVLFRNLGGGKFRDVSVESGDVPAGTVVKVVEPKGP